jgi:hypothetical protein
MMILTSLHKISDRQQFDMLENLKLPDSILKRLEAKPDRRSSISISPSELNELRDRLEERLAEMKRNQDSMLVKVLRSVNELYEQYITSEFTIERGKFWF